MPEPVEGGTALRQSTDDVDGHADRLDAGEGPGGRVPEREHPHKPARRGRGPAWNRNPTAVPTATISPTVTTLRAGSARVRPASTAERAIGSDRNRSMMPSRRSCAKPIGRVAAEQRGLHEDAGDEV